MSDDPRGLRRFAHHPAESLDDVRLAAPVGSDDTGHARLNEKLGRVDEGFKARNLKPTEMH